MRILRAVRTSARVLSVLVGFIRVPRCVSVLGVEPGVLESLALDQVMRCTSLHFMNLASEQGRSKLTANLGKSRRLAEVLADFRSLT